MISILNTYETVSLKDVKTWFKAAPVSKFPMNGGACIKYKDKQIAVFNFTREETWYACQNLCPHKMEMVLSRGMIGEDNMEPKVACPLHKKHVFPKNGRESKRKFECDSYLSGEGRKRLCLYRFFRLILLPGRP